MKALQDKIKSVIRYTFLAGKHQMREEPGMFELFGADILIDKDWNVYLLEMNSNPSLLIGRAAATATLIIIHHARQPPPKHFETCRRKQCPKNCLEAAR